MSESINKAIQAELNQIKKDITAPEKIFSNLEKDLYKKFSSNF